MFASTYPLSKCVLLFICFINKNDVHCKPCVHTTRSVCFVGKSRKSNLILFKDFISGMSHHRVRRYRYGIKACWEISEEWENWQK